jgi:hypothetical protein
LRRSEKLILLPASIELAENLDAGRAGADHRFGYADEKPVLHNARNNGKTLRQIFWLGYGAEEAVHDIVSVVADEGLAARRPAQPDLALAAASSRSR